MIGMGLMFSLINAVFITVFFYFILGIRGPWKFPLGFFLIIFAVSFAAGEWIIHAGPVIMGYYWVPSLIAAILVAILLASVSPPKKPKSRNITYQQEKEPGEGFILGILFWIFIILLIISGIIGVVYK